MPAGRQGFTIIELLISIAVIAMLTSFAMVLLSKGKTKSRDSRREGDIKQIQNALNLYVVASHLYPVCGRGMINGTSDCLSQALLADNFMPEVPIDPLGENQYYYTSNGFSYTLEYALETDNILGKSAGWQSIIVVD